MQDPLWGPLTAPCSLEARPSPAGFSISLAAAQGERSGAASPWTPTGPLSSLAFHSLPTAWGYTGSPYGRRKRAKRSLLAGGRMRPVPLRPPRPPAAPVRTLPGKSRPPPTARAGRGRAPGRRPDRARSVATGAASRQGPARNPAQAPARGAGPGGGCRADP